MAAPTLKQQERARTRIRQLVASKPDTKTRTQEKIRIGRKLGYSGKDKNISRSVDRLIMQNRSSPSARNLSSDSQVRIVDRAWYSRTKNTDFILKSNQQLSVLQYLPVSITADQFLVNNETVWTTRNVPKILFREKTGIVRGNIVTIDQNDGTSDERVLLSVFRGIIPLAATFGYLENKNDLYYLFNKRIKLFFQYYGDSNIDPIIIFKESGLTEEEIQNLRLELKMFVSDYKPGNISEREEL